MQKPLVLMALLAAGAVAIAPAALAQQETKTTRTDKPAAHQHGNMGMTSKGPSVAFLVHHAYKEAVHANESVAFGMNAMATNHLENVGLVLGSMDLSKDISDAKMRDQVRAILDRANTLDSNPTAQGTQQLVGQFATLISAMPAPRGGGGGQGVPLTPMMHMPGELVSMAASSAVDTQVDVAHRDFAGAKLHAQHTVAVLDAALKSAQLNKLNTQQTTNIRTLHTQARAVLNQVNTRSSQADESAGKLVSQIGSFLPALAPRPTAGGGAGMGNEKSR